MRKISEQGLKKKCDKLWGQVIHKLYKDKCLICDPVDGERHAGNPEAHHLITRSCLATRHDPRNGVILCSLHHKYSRTCSPHSGPLGFVDYIHKHYPELNSWYNQHRFDKGKPNYLIVLDVLNGVDKFIDEVGHKAARKILFMNSEMAFTDMTKETLQDKL